MVFNLYPFCTHLWFWRSHFSQFHYNIFFITYINFQNHSRLWQHHERMNIFSTQICFFCSSWSRWDFLATIYSEVSQKLLSLYIGPFKVLTYDLVLDDATLELPPAICQQTQTMEGWPLPKIFSISLNPTNPAATIDENSDEIFEAEQILDTNVVGCWCKWKFLVWWKGYNSAHDTWEPAENPSTVRTCWLIFLLQYPLTDFSLVDTFGATSEKW